MVPTTPDLPLETAPETHIYNAVIDRVMNDPVLSKVCGEIYATPFRFDPPPIQKLPKIRIEAGSGTVDSSSMITDKTTMMIGFVLTVANGKHRDLMNLWHALRKCMTVHRDDWLAQSLANVHGAAYQSMAWRQPAITYRPIMETRALESVAILEITLTVKDC